MTLDVEAGTAKVMEDVVDLKGIGPAAIWADLRLSLPLARRTGRVAIVTDQAWIRALAGLGRLSTSAEIRTFASRRIEGTRSRLRAA